MTIERGIPVKQAADDLGYSPDTIRRMIRTGEIRAYGKGRGLRVVEASILDWQRREDYGLKKEHSRESGRAVSQGHTKAVAHLRQLGLI